MKVPSNPSEAFCEVLRFADRVRISQGLTDREFRLAMAKSELIEREMRMDQVGRVECAALAVAVFRCGQRARARQAKRYASN